MREKNNDPKWLGQKFGRLTVVGFRKIPNGNYSAWGWDCKCDCGNMLYGARPRSLRHGTTASCGCLKEEQNIHNLGEKRITHGKTNTRIYAIWSKMKDRCNNEHAPAYKNYGGRGIKLCEQWEHDFQSFYDWAMSHGYEENLSIERIDVNGNYCPNNCCWIPIEEQARNKRNIRFVEVNGKKMPLKTACEELNLPYKAVHLRITRYGMSVDEAMKTPFADKEHCLAQKCRELGLPYGTISARLKSGWSEERALSEPIHHEKGPQRQHV